MKTCRSTWGFIKLDSPDEKLFTLTYDDGKRVIKMDFMGYTPEEAVEELLNKIQSEEELICEPDKKSLTI